MLWFTVWMENAAAVSKDPGTTTTANGPISLPWSTSAPGNGSRTATIMVRDSANATGRASITLNVAN